MSEREEYTAETYPTFGKKYANEKAIISLTSWKARINTVSKTLFSLLNQCPGFHIVLVLSEEEFPKMMDELPDNLKLFVDNELIEILWVYKNYKSFKKVLFTMDKYHDVPIISADDDCIYTCNYAQILYNTWLQHKDCIITNDGMPYRKFRLQWGRGPNTLYPPKFSYYTDFIIHIVANKINIFSDDDCFYGVVAEKMKIHYIDLNKKSFYVFHTQIEPFHLKIKDSCNYINYFRENIVA
ncbi:MAG: hypothetical protein ACI4V7_12615 [Succinivibrionaceae bacterium]